MRSDLHTGGIETKATVSVQRDLERGRTVRLPIPALAARSRRSEDIIVVSVKDEQADSTSRGGIRALYDWLTGATAAPPTTALPAAAGAVPDRIGRYAIERKLGEGGMGIVYAARDERLERTIALKTLSTRDRDAAARQRLWREARAAASVNHPNVCQIYEVGEEDGSLFIAMELLEGQSLADRLRAVGAPRARNRAPGPEALERVPDGARRQAARLRAGATESERGAVHRDRTHVYGDRDGHAPLQGAGAGRE
jgi:hypothetical protein